MIFDLPAYIKVLAYLINNDYHKKPIYIMDLSYNMKISYAHIFKLIKKLHKYGAVNLLKQGRTTFVTLTKKGEILGQACRTIQQFAKLQTSIPRSGKK